MNPENNTKEIDAILNRDVNEIAERGKNKHKRVLKFVIAVSILFFVFAISCVVIDSIKKEQSYQTACELMRAEEFAKSQEIFEELGDYKESRKYKKLVKEAITFLDSRSYDSIYYYEEGYIDKCEDILDVEACGSRYDCETKTLTFTEVFLSEYALDVNNITPQELATWVKMVNETNALTKETYEDLQEDGWDVNYVFEIKFEGDDEVKFSSKNGEETFHIIDIDTEVERTREVFYQQMLTYVESRQYAEAYNYWEICNAEGLYGDNYKDLKQIYLYTVGMYVYGYATTLYDYSVSLSYLEAIDGGYKDSKEVVEQMRPVLDSVTGEYKIFDTSFGNYADSYYKIYIGENGDSCDITMSYYYHGTGVEKDEVFFLSKDDVEIVVVDGKVQPLEINKTYVFKLTFVDGGIQLESSKETLNGFYKKVE